MFETNRSRNQNNDYLSNLMMNISMLTCLVVYAYSVQGIGNSEGKDDEHIAAEHDDNHDDESFNN